MRLVTKNSSNDEFFVLIASVAGPGGAPGLEDYATHVILPFLGVPDYIIPDSFDFK